MSQLERHVATVRSREATTQALRALATTLAVAAGVVILAILLEKFLLWQPERPAYRWLAGKPLIALAGVAGLAIIVGIVLGVRRRPSAEDAAVQIDQKLGTQEKFSTALYLQRDPQLIATDPFVRATVMDAISTADRVDLAGRFPIQFPRSFVITVMLALVAFGLSYLKRFDLFGREEAAKLAQVEVAKQEAAKHEIDSVLAQIAVAAPDVQQQEDVQLAKQKLQELATGSMKDTEAGQRTAAKAQEALNDATAFKEKLKNAQAFAKARNNQKMLGSLDDPKDQSPVSEVQRDIKKGDMDAAIEKMSDLSKNFDHMDQKEKEKAADQMQAMAQQMQQAVQQNPQLQQLAQQMQQQGVSQQQVQQLQQLMQQAAQGNQQAAQQAQQQAQQMMKQAGASPQQMQAAQQLAQQMQGVQNSQALMQQMQQAAQQMAQAMQQQAQQGGQQQASQQGSQQGQQGQQAGQQQGQQQSGQQQGQQGQKQGQGQQQSQQGGKQGQQQGQQGGQKQGGQQQGGQQQGGQQQGGPQQGGQQQGGVSQGAQQMQDTMSAIKQDMQQMQAAQRNQQQGGQGGGSGGQQGGGGQQGQNPGNGQKPGGQGGQGVWKQGDPQGNQGAGQGGPGQGAGGKGGVEEAPFDFKEEISKSQDNDKGQVLAQTLVKSDSEKGESTAELRDVVKSNEQESTDEVDNQRISRQAQKAVKDYFSGITGQAAEPAPAPAPAPDPAPSK